MGNERLDSTGETSSRWKRQSLNLDSVEVSKSSICDQVGCKAAQIVVLNPVWSCQANLHFDTNNVCCPLSNTSYYHINERHFHFIFSLVDFLGPWYNRVL